MLPYKKSLKQYSRDLRNNMTDAERLLWSNVRKKQLKGCQFYRQKSVGNYIVDFYCPQAKLVIEIDGGQHYTEEGQATDRERDCYMESMGLKILRFSNKEIFDNIDGVLEEIWQIL